MKKLLFTITIFCSLAVNAQNYLISFAGIGASTTVNTVKVENLTAGTSCTLNGNDVLHLTGTVGINPIENERSSELKIYPNPMIDNTTVIIYPSTAGDAIISIYEITGRQVIQMNNYLDNCIQEFQLSGLNNGLYLIEVKGNAYQFSGKLLCYGKSNGPIIIDRIGNNIQASYNKISEIGSKGIHTIVDMQYTTDDILKFTGISGNYRTVFTDIPVKDEIITFNFVLCLDGDNNNYPIVDLEIQFWMAENLKTTKYRNGDLIGTTTPATLNISSESTPKYQWAYKGDEGNVATYGRLYTFYTITDNRKICPSGWHVPTDEEWTTLTDFLYGEVNAGWFLKETGTTHWNSPNDGIDLFGFTALPGGYRTIDAFIYINSQGGWWSSTEYSMFISAWSRSMSCGTDIVDRGHGNEKHGLSIRCIKD